MKRRIPGKPTVGRPEVGALCNGAAGMTEKRIMKLQIVKFFYGKPGLVYQFAKQSGTEFTMLGDG